MIDNFVSRHDLGWPATPAPVTVTNLGMVAHYDSSHWLRDRRAALKAANRSEHTACIEYWNRVRSEHKGQGWLDIGYAYFACPDGWVFAGREVNHQQAAELPTPGKLQNGNSRYVACTFGLGVGETPTDKAIGAWHRLRNWLMGSHGVKSAVYGHRDFTSTDCPGDVIYALRNSKLKTTAAPQQPATPPTEPQTPASDDKGIDMDYASFGATEAGPTALVKDGWVDINFDTEYADPTKAHPDTGSHPTLLLGKPYIYVLEFGADVVGAQPGDVFDVDCAEYVYDGSVKPPVDKLVEEGKTSPYAVTSDMRLHHVAVGSLRKNGKLRVRVRSHSGASDVSIHNARVSIAFSE